MVENRIKLRAQGTTPLKYQWFKDDEELSDGEDYKGSASPALVIEETGPQSKGNYKCQVSNEYGNVFSQEKIYRKSNTDNLLLPAYYSDTFLFLY